jgi:transcriptional regulator with XRE-family HTH domain
MRGAYFNHPGIRRLREAAGAAMRSAKGIAGELGLSHSTGARWFTGSALPSRDQAIELERVLDLPPGELTVLFGYLPNGKLSMDRDQPAGELRIVVRVSENPGYLNSEPLFDPDPFLVAA